MAHFLDVTTVTDKWFWEKFRVSREMFMDIAEALRLHELPVDERGFFILPTRHKVDPQIMLLVVLARIGDGGFWHVIEDLFDRVSAAAQHARARRLSRCRSEPG